jgi:hypothetical protein
MKMHIYVIAGLMFAISVLVADTFTINGRVITVPTPKGFVRITGEMTAVNRFVQQMEDPLNDMLAYYIPESDVPDAMNGEIPRLERILILKVGKHARKFTIGKDDFSRLKEMIKSQNSTIFEKLKSMIPEHMNNISRGIGQEFDVDIALDISQMVPLEPHYEAENVLAYSIYVKSSIKDDAGTEESVVATTLSQVNASGVVLNMYCTAPSVDLEWTRDASITWSERVMSSNSQPPAKSPSRGLDWRKIVIAGIMGGLVALSSGASFYKRRKTHK